MLKRAPNLDKSTAPYKALSKDMLPKGIIHKRARRWTTKLFLSHFHFMLYVDYFASPPPLPYIISHGDHNDTIKPPLAVEDPELNAFHSVYEKGYQK